MSSKYVFKLDDGEELDQLYREQKRAVWMPEEIDLAGDLKDWTETLNSDERTFIKNVLAFFSGVDMIVVENLVRRFVHDVEDAGCTPAARFYVIQAFIEQIHAETYSNMILAFAPDERERDQLFSAIERTPHIKAKADWAQQWIASDRPLGERVLAFAAIEGIMFSASFASIFWLKKRGLMPGLAHSNELISADEALHCRAACAVLRWLSARDPDAMPSNKTAHDIIGSALSVECDFVRHSLHTDLIGMNSALMTEYVEYVADWLLCELLGYPALVGKWPRPCPLDFMNSISLQGKTNFFEKRVSDYSAPSTATDIACDGDDF